MRTVKKFFLAGFFGGLGILTALILMSLLSALITLGTALLTSLVFQPHTPEAAARRFLTTTYHYGDSKQFQALATRKLSDSEVAVIYRLPQPEKGQSLLGCVVANRVFGGWEVDGSSGDNSIPLPQRKKLISYTRTIWGNTICGQVVAPEVVATVEATLGNGLMLRDSSADGFFALNRPRGSSSSAQISELRVLGKGGQVLRRINLN